MISPTYAVKEVTATIKNIGKGLRVVKDTKGHDVVLNPGDTKTFSMHPHNLRQIRRDSRLPNTHFEVVASSEDVENGETQGSAEGQQEAETRFLTDPALARIGQVEGTAPDQAGQRPAEAPVSTQPPTRARTSKPEPRVRPAKK